MPGVSSSFVPFGGSRTGSADAPGGPRRYGDRMSDLNTPEDPNSGVTPPTPPPVPPGGSGPMPPPPYGGPPPIGGANDASGFFTALFDFSFTTFITPKVVKVVYIIATVLLGLAFLVFLISSFTQSAAAGVAVLIIGPIVFVLYLAFIRMSLEFAVAIVRMSEDIHKRLPG
jgi:hypothetical protein